jgi:hypothetical protein
LSQIVTGGRLCFWYRGRQFSTRSEPRAAPKANQILKENLPYSQQNNEHENKNKNNLKPEPSLIIVLLNNRDPLSKTLEQQDESGRQKESPI